MSPKETLSTTAADTAGIATGLNELRQRTDQPLRILGLDPGLNHTGWGIIEVRGSTLVRVDSSVIDPPKGELGERLAYIAREVARVVRSFSPGLCAIERVFVNVNPQSTLRLGQARGAAIAAAALEGLAVEEFTPSEIKQAVTGTGTADKLMVQTMVKRLLALQTLPRTDEADSLACAIACANMMRLRAIEKAGETTRTYATARRGATGRGARAAWTHLIEKKGKPQ